MMKSNVSCNYNFRAAVAMNNIGVSLLQRKSLVDALDTLQKSFKLFQSITVTTATTSCAAANNIGHAPNSKKRERSSSLLSNSSDNICASDLLNEAYVKLAKSTNNCSHQFDLPVGNVELNVVSLLDFQFIDPSFLEAARSSPDRSILTAIRIEDFDLDSDAEIDPRYRLEPTVVLHNIGTLCRLLSEAMKVTTSTSSSSKGDISTCTNLKITQKGYKLCKQAQLNTLVLMNDASDSISTQQRSSLLLLTLKNLIFLSSDLSRVSDARAFFCLYCDIRSAIIQEEKDDSFVLSSQQLHVGGYTAAAHAA